MPAAKRVLSSGEIEAIADRAERKRGQKPRGGPPQSYTPELAEQICKNIAEGESLRRICMKDGMPSRMTVLRWLERDHEGFVAKYARAREAQADTMDDFILDVANACTPETAQADRVKIGAYQWRAMKLAPKKYGDKQQVEHTGAMKVVISEPDSQL